MATQEGKDETLEMLYRMQNKSNQSLKRLQRHNSIYKKMTSGWLPAVERLEGSWWNTGDCVGGGNTQIL